jgi:hypothetical protein
MIFKKHTHTHTHTPHKHTHTHNITNSSCCLRRYALCTDALLEFVFIYCRRSSISAELLLCMVIYHSFFKYLK